MQINDYRKYFPVTDNYLYFNHAGVAPLNTFAVGFLNSFINDYVANGSFHYTNWIKTVSDTKSMAANIINATPDEIAIVKNTTSGILLVANGLDFRPGDNVIVPEMEFPANVYPWLNLKKKGVEVRFAKWRDGRIEISDLLALIDSRTRLLSISFVQFSNGFRINLEELGHELKKRGVLLCVDAIQGMGVFDIDVKRDNIDFLSADSHKWLLGVDGVGFFYCRSENLDKLEVTNLGYLSTVTTDYLDYSTQLKPNASRFLEGSLNMIGIHAVYGSLKLISEVGVKNIRDKIIFLTDYLVDGLTRMNCKIISPRDWEGEKSGIVSFVSKNHDTNALYENLMKKNCFIALRNNAIRVSPHFYNSPKEIDTFLSYL